MTPSACLAALRARLTAAGLNEVRSPLGARAGSSPRIDQSFAVIPLSVAPSASPGRSRPNAVGMRVTQSFQVELTNLVKPGDHGAAPAQALTDLHTAWKYILADATTLSTDSAAIAFTAANTSYEGGGAFLLTRFQVSITYGLALNV
jgi:hypothetical protein